jgi:superfamily II DNA/RNA helicase
MNAEGDLLEKLIQGSRQISGATPDDEKEEIYSAFSSGELRALVIKPKIGAFGLNWQHCAHTTFFPSHSYEQYYQGVRRMWRFGQTKPVVVDIITTKGEYEVLKNLQRKAKQADQMFTKLVGFMNDSLKIDNRSTFNQEEKVPSWL